MTFLYMFIQFRLILALILYTSFYNPPFFSYDAQMHLDISQGQGVTRAHTPESQVHTGTILHHFFHPESPAHTDWSHVRTQPFSRVTRAHRLGVTSTHTHNFASFFPPTITRAHITWDRVGFGVGWGGDDDILLHQHTCFQSAAEWTASVHTLHMSKPVM